MNYLATTTLGWLYVLNEIELAIFIKCLPNLVSVTWRTPTPKLQVSNQLHLGPEYIDEMIYLRFFIYFLYFILRLYSIRRKLLIGIEPI